MNDLEYDYIRVPKAIAQKYNQAQDQEAIVLELIRKKSLDLTRENETLEENLLVFKSVCLRHFKELEKVYNAENEKLESLWENLGDHRSRLERHSRKLACELEPMQKTICGLQAQVQSLSKQLDYLSLYIPERMLSIVKYFKELDEGSREMLSLLLHQKGVVKNGKILRTTIAETADDSDPGIGGAL